MNLIIEIPRYIVSKCEISRDVPILIIDAWIWSAINKSVKSEKWYVSKSEDKGEVYFQKTEEQYERFLQFEIEVIEGSIQKTQFYSSDKKPIFLELYDKIKNYEPKILEDANEQS